jgi:hypothetical protein
LGDRVSLEVSDLLARLDVSASLHILTSTSAPKPHERVIVSIPVTELLDLFVPGGPASFATTGEAAW